MVTAPTPVCLRCGGPMFVHWIRGYVCPYCRQIDETRKVAKQIAQQQRQQQVHYQEPEYHDSGYYEQPAPDQGGGIISNLVEFAIGCVVVLLILGIAIGVVVGVWNAIVYPAIHFITFGLI